MHMNRSRQKGKKSYVTQVVERGGKQNAGLKVKTNGTVAECRVKRYIIAAGSRYKGKMIYDTQVVERCEKMRL